MTDSIRYAFYFAPDADSVLGRFGNTWMGFNPATREDLPRPKIWGIAVRDMAMATDVPSRYGFHATLKPPFSLAEGRTIDDLDAEAHRLVARFRAFDIPKLQLTRMGDFLALTPDRKNLLLDQLAAACVRDFDPFRAQEDGTVLQRRRKVGLTGRQERLLNRWGYPYVLDEFRFHLTLTGQLSNEHCAHLQKTLRKVVSRFVDVTLPVRDIALFQDPGDGGRFRLLKRYPLG